MNNLERLFLDELALLQDKMTLYKIKESDKESLLKLFVPDIYAKWEGFVKKSLSLYLKEINKERLSYKQLDNNYLAYQTDQLVKFKSPKTDFNVVKKTVEKIYSTYQQNVDISTRIDTQSNINLEVINSLLKKLSLKPLDDTFDEKLDQLLLRRNIIAHGGEPVIEQKEINEFVNLIPDMAFQLKDNLVNGFRDKVYLKPIKEYKKNKRHFSQN